MNPHRSSLTDIPQNEITYDMCIKAVNLSIWAIFEVPEQFRTKELWNLVLKKNYNKKIYLIIL